MYTCTNDVDHLCWCLKSTVVASNHVLPSQFRFHLPNCNWRRQPFSTNWCDWGNRCSYGCMYVSAIHVLVHVVHMSWAAETVWLVWHWPYYFLVSRSQTREGSGSARLTISMERKQCHTTSWKLLTYNSGSAGSLFLRRSIHASTGYIEKSVRRLGRAE